GRRIPAIGAPWVRRSVRPIRTAASNGTSADGPPAAATTAGWGAPAGRAVPAGGETPGPEFGIGGPTSLTRPGKSVIADRRSARTQRDAIFGGFAGQRRAAAAARSGRAVLAK